MLKNFTRQLFTQLGRHLPRRLVQRDPLPDARNLASAPIPDSLGKHCLNVAAMDENEIWRAFSSHPEGLNAGEVAQKIADQEFHGAFRLIFNTGIDAGQTVFHVHAHVLTGEKLDE